MFDGEDTTTDFVVRVLKITGANVEEHTINLNAQNDGSFVIRNADTFDSIIVYVTRNSTDGTGNYDIILHTAKIDIISPTQSNQASAGAFDNPSHIEVTVEVKEGNTPITGLTIANFTIKIGGKEATASIIDTSIPSKYVFDVSPPQQESWML